MIQALVVDDSAVIRKVARRILEGLQFETAEADDGDKALTACAFLMPDLILLDWNMPVLDGFAVLRALRKMPNGRKPTVVLCTTEWDVAHIARAMHAGANDVMMKPFNRALLHAKLDDLGFINRDAA